MHRVKLNDYVNFPQVLNMNPCIHRDHYLYDMMDLDQDTTEIPQDHTSNDLDSLNLKSFSYNGKDSIPEDSDKLPSLKTQPDQNTVQAQSTET